MKLIESFVKTNPCYTRGKKMIVRGLMLHSVGCSQPSARKFMPRFDSTEAKVCVHAFIDAETGEIYQTLPWEYKAWHCGGSGNGTHIGVEMCEPRCIAYGAGMHFTCADEAREGAGESVRRTLHAAVELFAFLCRQYGLDPLGDGVIVSHKEGHDRGIASGHGDPEHLFRQLQMDYTMDDFRKAVAAALGETKEETEKEVGDIVILSADAVYYSGKAMPDWVKNDRWVIRSITDDRAVLGKNVSGSHEINSPVNLKYLTVCSDGEKMTNGSEMGDKKLHAAEFVPAGSISENGEMHVSDRGVELIARYEGCRLEAYKCPAGVWTIGYRHTAGVQPGQTLPSKEAAKVLLKEDLRKYGGYVNECVNKGHITFPLTQNQFDALTSFCYNCGNGALQKLVSGRDASVIADKLLLYNKAGGREFAGLTKRREDERALFLT